MEEQTPKFISLSPAVTEILYAVGAEPGLAANTRHCDYPARAKGKNRIEIWEQPSAELASKWGANVIFTDQPIPEAAVRSCGQAGVAVVANRPATLEEVFQGIIKIGDAAGRRQEAERVAEGMRTGLAGIAEASKGIAARPRVYVEEAGKPPVAAGWWVPRLVEIAGGDSGLVKEGERPRDVSRKRIFEYNPEAMVACWRGSGGNVELKAIEDRGWHSLNALAADRLLVMDDALLLRPVPRLVEGTRMLAEFISRAFRPATGEDDGGWMYSEGEPADQGRDGETGKNRGPGGEEPRF
ncbi:MAG: ABC transporter substrate-binding protein [Candidatus Micrarchaeota archaeon]